MKFNMKKLMSLVLLVTMIVGLVPVKAYATEPNTDVMIDLTLNEEVEFELKDKEDSREFYFTAEVAGTYIFYIKDLSENMIELASPEGSVQYNNPHTNFQGHAMALKAGETMGLTLSVSDDGNPYSGTAGVALPAETLSGFYSTEEFPEEGPSWSAPMNTNRDMVFYADDNLAYGVEWSVEIEDDEILELDIDATAIDAVRYEPSFRLKKPGETEVSIMASYKGASFTKTYVVQVTDEENPGEDFEEPSEQKGFEDFEELRILCGQEVFRAEYVGNKPLVIDEDFGLPEGLELEMNGQGLEVANGVTFSLNNEPFSCGALTIKGTLVAPAYLSVGGDLDVSGMLSAYDTVDINGNLTVTGEAQMHGPNWTVRYPYEIKGIDNINFIEDHMKVEIEVYYTDSADLKAKAEAISTDYLEHERCKYRLCYSVEDPDNLPEEFVVAHDVTIPAYAYISFVEVANYTIAEGKTFTNNGEFNIHRPLKVLGTLCNNGDVRIFSCDSDKGILYIPNNGTETGNYTGSGKIGVMGSGDDKIEDLLQVDAKILEDFDIKEHIHGDGNREWEFIYAAGLIKLATPLNPTWGIEWTEQGYWDEENEKEIFEWVPVDRPGMISWETARPDQAEVEIKLYKKGETEPCDTYYYGFGVEEIPMYRSVHGFMESNAESGTYYFTVQSIGDYKEYRSSDIAVSGYYEYVNPEINMGTASNLRWQDRNDGNVAWAMWDMPTEDTAKFYDGYHVEVYFSETTDGEWEEIGGTGGRGSEYVIEDTIPEHFFQERGQGYYRFRVKFYSGDIEKCLNSEYSEFSPILDMKTIPTQTTLELEKLVQDAKNNSVSAEDIKTEVQKMNSDDLKETLLTDNDNSGATKQLAELEKLAGGPADVVVSNDAKAFDENKVSIVGANLNKNASEEDAITLVLDKPEEEHVIPERYNSSVAIRFSMTLDNVEDPSNLKVPVKITLPVPSSINPHFLVVFHYHADGTHEIIRPYVYQVDGQWYTDLVLTSFSDFIMTYDTNSGVSGGESAPSNSSSTGSKKPVSAVPKTGDVSMVMPYMLAVVISGCCLVYYFSKRRYTE